MNYPLLAYSGIALLLLMLLVWLSLGKRRAKPAVTLGARAEREWRHISYLPYIKQALASADTEFLKARGSAQLAKRVKNERRQIALKYLQALRSEFDKLVEFARVLAVMSPEVELAQELQGLRLQFGFSYRYHLIYARLALGIAPSNALGELSDMVSGLAVRMETAIAELGERAALAGEMASLQ